MCLAIRGLASPPSHSAYPSADPICASVLGFGRLNTIAITSWLFFSYS